MGATARSILDREAVDYNHHASPRGARQRTLQLLSQLYLRGSCCSLSYELFNSSQLYSSQSRVIFWTIHDRTSFMAHCVEGHVVEYGRFRDQRAYELRPMLEASTPRRQCALFFWTPGAMNGSTKLQSSQANSGCMLSGARRVHPVIVGWSTANRPLLPKPINDNP